jgi:hypothetical protein
MGWVQWRFKELALGLFSDGLENSLWDAFSGGLENLLWNGFSGGLENLLWNGFSGGLDNRSGMGSVAV